MSFIQSCQKHDIPPHWVDVPPLFLRRENLEQTDTKLSCGLVINSDQCRAPGERDPDLQDMEDPAFAPGTGASTNAIQADQGNRPVLHLALVEEFET